MQTKLLDAAEAEGTSTEQTAKAVDQDSSVAAQPDHASTTAQSTKEHPEHAVDLQQVQQPEGVPEGELTTTQQSTSELEAGGHVVAGHAAPHVDRSMRSKQLCLPGLKFLKMGERKSSSCSPAVKVAAVSSVDCGETAAATGGASPLDTKFYSSTKSRAMQKLKSLVKKVKPSCICMPATDTGTRSPQVIQQQQQQQQEQGLTTAQGSMVEMEDKAMEGSGRVQLVAAPVHASTPVDDQQALPQPGNKNQRCSKLRGVFRRKKPTALFSEQAESESAMGNGTESMPELVSSDFIAAVRGPSGVEPQAEASGFTAAGKPADQVRNL